jgi:hypothetical protein
MHLASNMQPYYGAAQGAYPYPMGQQQTGYGFPQGMRGQAYQPQSLVGGERAVGVDVNLVLRVTSTNCHLSSTRLSLLGALGIL